MRMGKSVLTGELVGISADPEETRERTARLARYIRQAAQGRPIEYVDRFESLVPRPRDPDND